MISIISEPTKENPFLVIDKPAGLPSAPLELQDDSALTEAVKLFPFLSEVKGIHKSIELGLLHRLDTATRGILVIASTQEAYERMLASQKNQLFRKWYRAEVEFIDDFNNRTEGFPPLPLVVGQPPVNFSLESSFRPFGKNGCSVRPVTNESGKAASRKSGLKTYSTDISISKSISGSFVADCSITSGYRHQVRCHLAWVGFPVKGDVLYNPLCKNLEVNKLSFTAYKVSFPHPITNNIIEFSL